MSEAAPPAAARAATPAAAGQRVMSPSTATRLLRLAAVATSAGLAAQKFRSLRISGILLAVSGVASVLLVAGWGAPDAADIVALRILAYSCWLYGGLGLYALLDPKAREAESGGLSILRGQEMTSWGVRTLAFTRRLSMGMWMSALPAIVAAVVVSPEANVLAQRLGLLLASALYLLSLSLILSMLGAFCLGAAPTRARSLCSALVLGPFLLSFLEARIPSIPGIYSWLLGVMIDWGARVT